MLEIRFHGRGGQGAVTAAELLAQAAIGAGRHAQGFPNFGAERRGAPVCAYLRLSERPIRLREKIEAPDAVVVMDPTLVGTVDVLQGLPPEGWVILNSPSAESLQPSLRGRRLALVDASRVALEVLGVPIVNTAMIGAVVRATGLVDLESLVGPLEQRFGKLAEKNRQALRRAYEQTVVLEPASAPAPSGKTAAPASPAASRPEALHPWQELPIGGDVEQPGSSAQFHTGNWRTVGRPVTDYGRCTRCGICWVVCPDVAWQRNAQGSYDLDERYCKGCGTCAEQCPREAIVLQGETA